MGTLLVVTGPPGAGKSTVARSVADRYERSVLLEGDAFFRFIARGAITPWLPQAHEQNQVVIGAAAAAAGRYVLGGLTTVFDGMVGPWFVSAFLEATGLDRLDYVVILPSVERCVERVRSREGHGFTDEAATRSMHRQFADAEIDPRHIFHDPPDDSHEAARLVVTALEEGLLAYSRDG